MKNLSKNLFNIAQKNNLKPAFTLAEVLITLAIIGVVAAMTIPTMMQKIQTEQFRVALKKEYSAFTQAINNLQSQNSSIDTSSADNFVNELATQLLIQKQGTYSSLTSLPANYNYKCYKNASGNCSNSGDGVGIFKRPTADGFKTFITNDGTLFAIRVISSTCTNANLHARINRSEALPQNNLCVSFSMDLNGDKNPNQLGMDMHLLYLLKKNNNYYVRVTGSNIDSICSTAYPNNYNYSLHCSNRMLLDEQMP